MLTSLYEFFVVVAMLVLLGPVAIWPLLEGRLA